MLNAIQVFDAILDLFKNLGEFVIVNMPDGTQPSDLLLALAIGGFLIYIIFAWIRSNASYEAKLIKSLDSMNNYFYKNPIVNSDNLKEFNSRMKSVPKAMRVQWQTFMLYRDKEPSKYLTLENCVERPMKYTTYKNSLKNTSTAFNIYMILLMAIVGGGVLFNAGDSDLGAALFNCLMVPAIIYMLKFLLGMILEIRYNAIVSDIYTNFNIFQRAMDKAVVGLPEYIDFEMLFTRKEIKDNIPILQDYIERRERKEREELEKAKNSEVEHENFDFNAVGLNASLLLERAMRECETYTNNKKRLLYKIAQKHQELQDYKNNYENLNKEQLKQQQVSKENLERLRHSAETSTNRVEAGRIAKQQEEELKRQEQLEKDAQLAYDKYLKQKDVIDVEVKALEAELAEKKQYIEDVIMAEFKTYTSKLYDDVTEKTESKYSAMIAEMKEDNEILADEVKSKIILLEQNGIDAKPTLRYDAKLEKDKIKEAERLAEQEIENEARLEKAMQTKLNADKLENQEEDAETEQVQEENEVQVDVEALEINEQAESEVEEMEEDAVEENAEDEEISTDEMLENESIDDEVAENEEELIIDDEENAEEDLLEGLESEDEFVEEEANVIDEEKIKEDLKNEITDEINQEKIKEDLRNELKEEINHEKIKEDLRNQLKEELKKEIKGELVEDNKYDSYGGYYDEKGNYVYRDGSYYDVQGNFFDATGKLLMPSNATMQTNTQMDNYGGYYDAYGNYIYEDGSYYDAQGNYYDPQGNLVQANDYSQDYADNQGYQDENGNYVYGDGSYYDPLGNYYDAQGNLVEQANNVDAMYKAETERLENQANEDVDDGDTNK